MAITTTQPLFKALWRELGQAQRPAYYLAIPPAAFGIVVEQLSQIRLHPATPRVIIEKPFGRDLRLGAGAECHSAQNL